MGLDFFKTVHYWGLRLWELKQPGRQSSSAILCQEELGISSCNLGACDTRNIASARDEWRSWEWKKDPAEKPGFNEGRGEACTGNMVSNQWDCLKI